MGEGHVWQWDMGEATQHWACAGKGGWHILLSSLRKCLASPPQFYSCPAVAKLTLPRQLQSILLEAVIPGPHRPPPPANQEIPSPSTFPRQPAVPLTMNLQLNAHSEICTESSFISGPPQHCLAAPSPAGTAPKGSMQKEPSALQARCPVYLAAISITLEKCI